MNILDWIKAEEEEKPLERLKADGGYTGIFRTLGIVGDSLSSGELEGKTESGEKTYHDIYDYSWGAYIGRMTGSKIFNFSRGGMTASEYMQSWAENNDFWNPKYAAQGYIVALGVNDLYNGKQEVGSVSDIDFSDYTKNKPTLAGYYAQIIQKLKTIQPNAKFFLVTMPVESCHNEEILSYGDRHQALLYELKRVFENCYVIDLRKYAPVYDEKFKQAYFHLGHMNVAGYLLTGKMIASYIDYIIRHNIKDFDAVGFIGTEFEEEGQR